MTAAPAVRATEAFDILLPTPSRADRDVPRASRGHFIAHSVLGDGAGVRVQAGSLLEYKWQLVLNMRPETLELREQVHFSFGGKNERLHIFDIVVTEVSGRRIAYTVKPEIRLVSGRFLVEMQEVSLWVHRKRFADDVRLLSDSDLDPTELHNARVLAAVREPDPEADARAIAVAGTLTGARTVRDLADATEMGARGYRAILRLLGSRLLCTYRPERITPDSLVQRGEEFA
ncbi:hypothetical protein LAZ29_07160 [Cereibacter sphaeroides]|uniref:hypothetical protein n=1 Tax=Cereibacter sphaeroides TaxID=1063 RepID=UPI001F36AB65|nr:hypothetical protein [Cereibacter sphaeroides]MCE6950704.1 hypothetical protein [Cereibacter sphaeroides]